jgi:hypothetical protein
LIQKVFIQRDLMRSARISASQQQQARNLQNNEIVASAVLLLCRGQKKRKKIATSAQSHEPQSDDVHVERFPGGNHRRRHCAG